MILYHSGEQISTAQGFASLCLCGKHVSHNQKTEFRGTQCD
jgi:hypothetical protein